MSSGLVTGGAGFIGSHLVRALLERGDRVRVLDNFSTGKRENLLGLGELIEVQEGDLRNPIQVAEAVKGIDFVFHQAAFVSVPLSMLDPQTCFDINVQGTLNVLEAARDGGVQRVVIASSAAVYGEPEILPLTEATRLRPLSPYAASKLVNEVYAGMFTRAYGLPVVALRYFNVYGPHQSPTSDYAAAIPIFIRRLLDGQAPEVFGDGLQRRDFVYVSDIARANLLAAGASQAAGEVFNICTGQEITLLDLLKTLARIIPETPAPRFKPPRPGDIHASLGDPQRAAELLGFSPQIPLLQGLSETVSWLRTPNESYNQ